MPKVGVASRRRTSYSPAAKVQSFGSDKWVVCAIVPRRADRPQGPTRTLTSASKKVRDLLGDHGCDLGDGYFSTIKAAKELLPSFNAALTESGKRGHPPVSVASPTRAAAAAKKNKKSKIAFPASPEKIQRVVEEQAYREKATCYLNLYVSLGHAWR